MDLLLVLVFFALIFFFVLNSKERLVKYGCLTYRKHIKLNKNNYYIEEVTFNNSQESLHNFYKIVADVAKYDKVLEVKYDLYDWSYTIFRFKNTTIALYNFRSNARVRLVKSELPVTINEMDLNTLSLQAIGK